MEDFEKLGAFYLGRPYDLKEKKPKEGLLLYDSKDLVTHAVCVGMTGSGKTGLCLAILEEAGIDGIPAIIIDPKGDLANLLLTFPNLRPEDFWPWINEEDARRKDRPTRTTRPTRPSFGRRPGRMGSGRRAHPAAARRGGLSPSTRPAAMPGFRISILRSFAAPQQQILEDGELFRERIATTATSLLGLLGVDADPDPAARTHLALEHTGEELDSRTRSRHCRVDSTNSITFNHQSWGDGTRFFHGLWSCNEEKRRAVGGSHPTNRRRPRLPGRRRSAGRGAGGFKEGRLQLPDPADPLGQVLPLPRARRGEPQGRAAAGHEGRGVRDAEADGHAIVPGEPRGERAGRRITAEDEAERMPPKSLGRTLTPEEIDAAQAVGRAGGRVEGPLGVHRRPETARCPEVKHAAWPRNPIDRFVLARLEAEGLTPSPEASKERLIRRVTLDLTGLPPTLAEIDAFLADDRAGRLRAGGRPAARLAPVRRADGRRLARRRPLRRHPRLPGRRRPRHVALARLGHQGVQRQPAVRPVHHLAARRRPAARTRPASSVLATAFNRLPPPDQRGRHRSRRSAASSTSSTAIDTFGTAFLGLTLECARCHDHKYDPITQKDYYSLFGFFNNIDESGLYSHFTDAMPDADAAARRPHEQDASDRRGRAEDRREAEAELERSAERGRGRSRPGCEGSIATPNEPPVTDAARSATSRSTTIKDRKVANRADPTKPGQAVEGPELVAGRIGKAPELSGENNVTLPGVGNFDRDRAVLARRSGSDARHEGPRRSSSTARRPGPTPAAGATSS